MVLPGCEINTDNGHVLIFGLDRYVFGLHKPDFLVDAVRQRNGAIIAAHPYRRRFLEDPGHLLEARREMLETYVKRMTQLEVIGDSFNGVQKTFAIQAGREVRIIVMPGGIDDQKAGILARDVAKRIEKEVTYPGEIKVTVVRETRYTEFAR